MSRFSVPRLLVALLFLSACPLAIADVTLEQKFKVDAVGAMAILASEGIVKTTVADNKLRTDNLVESASEVMQSFSKNANGSTIVLLEEQKVITLVPAKLQYSEMTFEQLREQLDYGTQAQDDAQVGADTVALPVDEEECRWSVPDMNVIRTREKAEIAGIKAEQYLIIARQTCIVPSTGQSCHMTWNLEHWAAKRLPGDEELIRFEDDLARALGGEDILSVAKLHAGGLMALFRRGWNQVLAESQEVKGYPVKTVMSMEIGGDSCTTAAGTPIAKDSDWTNIESIAKQTASNTARATATNAAAQTAAQQVGGGLGGSIAGTAVSEASRQIYDKYKNRKKEEEEDVEDIHADDPGDSAIMLFKISTELTGISEDEVPPEHFDTPQGWENTSP